MRLVNESEIQVLRARRTRSTYSSL